jgi:hypothetical protein
MARHPIELALDLARMPALARTPVKPLIPPNVVELMRIAAESPSACSDAVVATGESPQVVVQAARFYLQQSLFRPDADCYRILGLQSGASRATARRHMRLLLQWLHPDRNNDLDAVYAERVLTAWREVSTFRKSDDPSARLPMTNGSSAPFHLPWIKQELRGRKQTGIRRVIAVCALSVGLIMFIAITTLYILGQDQAAVIVRVP